MGRVTELAQFAGSIGALKIVMETTLSATSSIALQFVAENLLFAFVSSGLAIGFWSTSVRALQQQWSDTEAFLSLPHGKITTKPADDLVS